MCFIDNMFAMKLNVMLTKIQQGKFSLQQKWTAVVTAAHVVNMHSDVFPRCSILCGHACILYCMWCYILYQMGKYQVMSQFTYRLLDNVIVINNIFSEWIIQYH